MDPLQLAHDFFRSRRRDSWVPGYLAGRGFPEHVQRRFELGYAPPHWRTVVELLRSRGLSDDRIVETGLVRRSRHGRLYDHFRDRVMFPIRDPYGRIAGFIGRTADDVGGPRYLNCPDTERFHKGALLYTLPTARPARPVLVEGPLDALAVRLTGVPAAAPCGTRLTAEQAAMLGDDVLVAMDGDPAGRRGAVQAWEHLASLPGRIGAVVLPAGRDPADLLRDGGLDAVRLALRAEIPLADLVTDAAIDRHHLRFVEGQIAAARAAAHVIARMRPDQVARQVARTAQRLGFAPADVTAYVVESLAGM
ncbi:toprim domain-containing protein [Actinocorallia longicatena]|uniref:Toprim domain-containing protein n=1 Tax=Actinocorallia longicatena TaxID=111803 RepID=A0ABP6QFS8_9ACTN